MSETVYQLTTRNRLLLADMLDGLDERQWQADTLCQGWTVHHMAAHLVQPMLVGFSRFFLVALRYRGNTARTVDHVTQRIASRPPAELIAALRRHAPDHVDPPRVGPMGPFADTCIHLRDIVRPLGLDTDVPVEHWRMLLDYLVSPEVAPGLVPPARRDGLALQATDQDWSAGAGDVLAGTAEALAMAITGRASVLDELTGPGVERLRSQLSA